MQIPTVKEIMTRAPRVVDATEDSMTARAIMEQYGVRHLPVMGKGKLVGILSDRDLRAARAVLDGTRGEVGPPVLALCSHEPFVIDPDEPVDEAAVQMANRRLGAALVVKDEKLVGIVTTVDICRELARIIGRVRQQTAD